MTNCKYLFLMFCLLVVGGCESSGEMIQDDLDATTGVTVSRSNEPLVLYKDNSAHAAYARDFVYLGPVEVNRMGEYRYYLWMGIWSAIPDALPGDQRDGFEFVTIFADSEPLQLTLAGWTANSIGATGSVYVKPVASAADAFYEVTMDQIRVIASSRDIRLSTSGAITKTFELWDNQQSAFDSLQKFVDYTAY
jgi:hypothetical protein